jgi:hypothetical protein
MKYLLIAALLLAGQTVMASGEIGFIPRLAETNASPNTEYGYKGYLSVYEPLGNDFYINPYGSIDTLNNDYKASYIKLDVNKHIDNVVIGIGAAKEYQDLGFGTKSRQDIHLNFVLKLW